MTTSSLKWSGNPSRKDKNMSKKNIDIFVPTLKKCGGNKEIVKYFSPLEVDHSITIFSFWKSSNEVDVSETIKVKYVTNFKANRVVAILTYPLIILYVYFRSLVMKDRIIILTHYSTYLLSLMKFTDMYIFIQGEEWNYVNSALFKRLVLYLIGRGKIITANSFLESQLLKYGIKSDIKCNIWASNEFLNLDQSDLRDIDYIFVVRDSPVKRPDLYYEFLSFIDLTRYKIVLITTDEAIIDKFDAFNVDMYLLPSIIKMKELYGRSKFFLLLSEHEGFGLPPLEAMGSGCLPIMRDCYGPRLYMTSILGDHILPTSIRNIDLFQQIVSFDFCSYKSHVAYDIFCSGLHNEVSNLLKIKEHFDEN